MTIRGPRFNASVGRQRISASHPRAGDTMSAREDMASVVQNFRAIVESMNVQSAEILEEALEPTFAKSQAYCPKDTGELVRSGYLHSTSFRGRASVEIGYGKGGEPDYAATVHENLEWNHKSPTRAKWLQVALQEDEAAIQARIAKLYGIAGGFR